MTQHVICRAGVLHFAGSEGSGGDTLLVFGDRRPSDRLLDALCSAALADGTRLGVVRVATAASGLNWLLGGPSPQADILRVLEAVGERGVVCTGRVHWEATFPAGVVRAARRASPRFACVVPSTPGNRRSTRRALAFVGRLVDGRLAVADGIPGAG